MLSRKEIAARALTKKLASAKVGVVAIGSIVDEPEWVIERVAADRSVPLHAVLVVAPPIRPIANVVLASTIEAAVEWRNTPELAGHIVVFVPGEVDKLHSLADLDTLSPRDLTLTTFDWASDKFRDFPLRIRAWNALRRLADTLPLAMVEAFAAAVEADQANDEENLYAISDNLWRLGLLPDRGLLNLRTDPDERLRHNRSLMMEVSQLSEASRRRIAAALRADPDNRDLRSAYGALQAFNRYGRRDDLRNLSVALVDDLVRVSRPKPVSVSDALTPSPADPRPTVPVVGADPDPDDDLGVAREGENAGTSSVLSEGDSEEVIGRLAVDPSPESQSALASLLDVLRENMQLPAAERDEISVPNAFGGATLRLRSGDDDLRKLMGACCSADMWGGILDTPHSELRDAKNRFTPDQMEAYDPAAPSQNLGGLSLLGLFDRLDVDLVEVTRGSTFGEVFRRMAKHREVLVDDLDLVLEQPAFLFSGSADARVALDGYLDAYGELLGLFHAHEVNLNERKHAQATALVATELIRLDILHVRTPDEWKAVMTPLHPLHLWRYRQMFRYVHAENARAPMEVTEREQLIEALYEGRGVLTFLPLSQSVIGMNQKSLPLAGNLGLLPTYENDTNRYLGPDGVEFLGDLVRRWITDAPYTRTQVRVALVDVPDVARALVELRKFLVDTTDARVVCDIYVTRDHDTEGELARLDYEGQDHEVTDLLRTRRLSLNLRRCESLGQVSEQLAQRPVHLGYFFDQSQYRVIHAPRSKHLLVSPLVVVHDYNYDKTFGRGEIVPSTQTDEGLFSDFDYVVSRATASPAGQQQRLRQASGADLEPINSLLAEGRTRWLAVADRVLVPYHPTSAVPLAETLRGQREIGVWARDRSQSVRQYVSLLRGFNLAPDQDTLAALLRRFGHVATSGLLGLPALRGGSSVSDQSRRKGLVGAVLAAAWYEAKYPGCLIASLDSPLAHRWLQSRSASMERADLIGLRMEGEALVVEPIEVKALEKLSAAVQIVDTDPPTRDKRLTGTAVEQLGATIGMLRPIFGDSSLDGIFTPARREILKYQLYRECFRQVHEISWQEHWFELLNEAFAPAAPSMPVRVSGLIVHIHPEESGFVEETVTDSVADIHLVRLGQRAIQKLVRRAPSWEPETAVDPSTPAEIVDAVQFEPDGTLQTGAAESVLTVAQEQRSATGGAETESSRKTQTSRAGDVPPGAPAASTAPQPDDTREAEELARRFLRASHAYGIQVAECDPAKAVAGPTVLRFYVKLGTGQRLSELRSNLSDIGRQMSRSGLLVSQISNSSNIALDIPRLIRRNVPLSQGLPALGELGSAEEMPLALGVTPEGTQLVPDLASLPHLLVAGTTGSGKTMLLYSVLVSLLTKHPDPATLRLFLSTSKLEDFVFFEGLPHLEGGGVIDDASRAVALLRELVGRVFEERGAILTNSRCRDIGEYNRRNPSSALAPWVVVVDELADLADQLDSDRHAKAAFYLNLRRIAQLGRNRGVHLILCTQRPSADLVPTNIRALMNARVSLNLNDATASRMILEEPGAEQLQLKGDFLFKTQSTLIRGQGYHIETEELDVLLAALRS